MLKIPSSDAGRGSSQAVVVLKVRGQLYSPLFSIFASIQDSFSPAMSVRILDFAESELVESYNFQFNHEGTEPLTLITSQEAVVPHLLLGLPRVSATMIPCFVITL